MGFVEGGTYIEDRMYVFPFIVTRAAPAWRSDRREMLLWGIFFLTNRATPDAYGPILLK